MSRCRRCRNERIAGALADVARQTVHFAQDYLTVGATFALGAWWFRRHGHHTGHVEMADLEAAAAAATVGGDDGPA